MRNKLVYPREIIFGKKTVLCQGCFDLVHVGHIKHLRAAAAMGDCLVVAVTSDRYVNKGPHRPHFSQVLRMEQLAALEMVDYVVLSDSETAVDIIKAVQPDIYVKGSEYRDQYDITGGIALEKEAVETYGGTLAFTDEIVYSSSSLLNREFDAHAMDIIAAADRYDVTYEKVEEVLEKVRKLSVMVIGETIIDKYVTVETTSTPSKQSVVSCRYKDEEEHLGGAFATARHVSEFCDDVVFVSGMNGDVYSKARSLGYDRDGLFNMDDMIVKTRFMDDMNRVMFKFDSGNDKHCPRTGEFVKKQILRRPLDLVIVNDFGHGMIDKEVAKHLSAKLGDKLAVNTQTNSLNRGYNYITKYFQAGYVCLDLPEARLAVSERDAMPRELAEKLRGDVNANKLSITHGKYGSYFLNSRAEATIPALTSTVVDTTGAGDAYFAITSLLSKVSDDAGLIAFIGNGVGALATQVLGNASPVTEVQLKKFLKTVLQR